MGATTAKPDVERDHRVAPGQGDVVDVTSFAVAIVQRLAKCCGCPRS